VAAVRRRDWRIAAALSIVPGAGQVYNGQPRKALFYGLATLLTIGPAVLLITFGERIGSSLLQHQSFATFLLLALGSVLLFLLVFILGLYFWASAVVDARYSARELSAGVPGADNRWWFFHL
jgi:TM2 domain-containing membrane protein YozV